MESIEEDGVNIGSKLPGQLLQVHRLRTECSDLKERAAALKLEKMRLEKEVEKQERELEAVNQPTFDNLRFEEMSSFVNNGGPKMGQSISISLTDQYLRMRTELHRLKELLEEEKRKYHMHQPLMEEVDSEIGSKIDALIEKNLTALNKEQGQWSKTLEKVSAVSKVLILGRVEMDKKCSEVEEKVRAAEEEVWIRQAARCSSGYDQLNASSVEEEEDKNHKIRSQEQEVVDNIQVKELELESLTEALVKSKKMASELRVCHVSSVTHQQEVELKSELKEVVEAWQREKVEMEDDLLLERERVAKLAIDAQEDEAN